MAIATKRRSYNDRTVPRFALAIVVLAAVAAPRSEAQTSTRGETFRDWVVGCDNVLTCKAVGLSDGQGEVSVERAADPDAPPIVTFAPAQGVTAIGDVTITIDGRSVTEITEAVDPGLREGRTDADRLIFALAGGATLEIRVEDLVVATPSLSGATAALRYMDDRQGRSGTITALVARGARGAGTMRKPPQAPTISAPAPVPEASAAPLTADEAERALAAAACPRQSSSGTAVHALPAGASLVLVPCDGERYNSPFRALLGTGTTGARTFALASFDAPPPSDIGAARAMVYNPVWDAAEGVLIDDYKGREAGDCGSGARYAWDGTRFRRILFSSMWECRGSSDRITLWRAGVVRR